MFQKVRQAAQAGRRKSAQLLKRAGRALKRTALYGALGGLKLLEGALFVVHKITRLVSWTWMSAVEVYSMSQSPFTWAIGNVLWWLLRTGENVVNWIRKTEYHYMHNHFPAFTILNAVAFTNLALYPLVALVGWLLSPLTGVDWWRSTAHGYKVRTVSAADFAYVDRIRNDIGFHRTFGTMEDFQKRYPGADFYEHNGEFVMKEQMDEADMNAAQYYERQLAQGFLLVYPDTNVESPHEWDYLEQRIREATDESWVTEFEMTLSEDRWGRFWASLPDGVSTQKPARVQTVDLPEPAEEVVEEGEPIVETPVAPKHSGLVEFDLNTPPDNYRDLADPKERSFWYGVTFLRESAKQITGFLNDTNQQSRARAILAKDTSNPQTGFLMPYALKGFEAALEHDQEVASKV
jgi:hypothetical protein